MNISGYCQSAIILLLLQTKALSINLHSINSYRSTEYVYTCNITDVLKSVLCHTNGAFDLKLETARIAQQHPNSPLIPYLLVDGNAFYTDIPDNAFSGTRFGGILLFSAPNLTRVHKNAFSSTASTTAILNLGGLLFPTKLRNSPPEYDLYYALSTLTNATKLQISLDRSVNHEIPDNAFRNVNGVQSTLSEISFEGVFNISRIGNNAFNEIPFQSKSFLNFTETRIEKVSSNAFDLKTASNEQLTISLWGCHLTHDSFEDNVFSSSRRPLKLFLDHNNIAYIREKTFSSFFAADQRNVMSIGGNSLNCSDTASFKWLLDQKQKYENRVLNGYCHNARKFWDFESNGSNGKNIPSDFYFVLMLIISLYFIFTIN